ncbi:MAG: TRAP transporter small permease subunit [Hyphomicrobiaceae bacterium]|nr:TRAP transporter small permease subunit [Hyphomicrobiaceae bacterium]
MPVLSLFVPIIVFGLFLLVSLKKDGLKGLADRIDAFHDRFGKYVAWLSFILLVVQMVVVLARYLYGAPNILALPVIMWQESIIYMHGFLFMLGAAYTLRHDGHVRVDIFYREAPISRKAMVNLLGALFLLLPMCGTIWAVSWTYVASSWQILEGSRETSGLQAVFLLKTAIPIFAISMAIQGISMILRSLLALKGDADSVERLRASGGGH